MAVVDHGKVIRSGRRYHPFAWRITEPKVKANSKTLLPLLPLRPHHVTNNRISQHPFLLRPDAL
jgi:hypothetical protein